MTLPQLPNASPTVPLAKLEYYTAAPAADAAPAWRTGKTLIVAQGAVLPERCVKCNEPTDRRFRRRVSWYPSYLLAGFITPLGPLFLLLLYLVLKKTMRIDVGVCRRHLRRRRWFIAGAFVALAGCAYAIVYTVGHQSVISCVASAILAVAAAVMGHYARILRPTKIDTLHGYFRGASPEFLNSLPGVAAPPR